MAQTRDPEWEVNAEKNAKRISSEINSLNNGHHKFPFGRDYKAFFAHAKEITALFKTLKPLKRDDREELWNEFSTLCDRVRREQKDEWLSREIKSKQERDVCLPLIQQAIYAAKGARDRSEIQNARNDFDTAHRELRERSRNMLRQHSQECWEAFKQGKRTLHFRTKELQDYAYSEAKSAVSDARNALFYKENPYDALNEIKLARSRTKGLYLGRDHAQYIRKEFDDIWQSVIARIEEHKKEKARKHEEWLRRKEEKERKHQEWLSRQRDNISRWESRIDRLEDVVRRLESQIDDLEYKRSTARSSSFADRCWGWIREKQDKISDIESTIRELQGKISDVRSKIGY